jgi:2-polyprenyl-3-methyl-5-hydroxy-6-metoxy-1,4-benzoquinol methylase
MPRKDISSYTHEHRHFYTDTLQPLLLETATDNPGGIVAELGAGDGSILWALEERGLLGEIAYAVDLSAERVARAEQVSPKICGVVADATHVEELPDGEVDGVLVSQVIEHLDDDRALAPEIARLLKPGGWWYVGTIVRGRRAWWIYRVDGKWQVDPTHVREYRSEKELLSVLAHPELWVGEVRTTPLRFPVLDLALRAAATLRMVAHDSLSAAYVLRPRLLDARRLRIRVPGYRLLEVCGSKVDGGAVSA